MNKQTITKYAVAVVLGLGVVLGVSSLQAAWTTPAGAPPGSNVDAPVNVGLSTQSKLGQLFVNTDPNTPFSVGLQVFGKTILNGGLQIASTSVAGKVLTADANGNATWQTASALPTVHINYLNPKSSVSVKDTALTVYAKATNTVVSGIAKFADLPSGTVVNTDTETLNKVCSVLVPSTPYVSTFLPVSYSSPSNNWIVVWSSARNRFERWEANTVINGVDNKHLGDIGNEGSPSNALGCSDLAQITTQL